MYSSNVEIVREHLNTEVCLFSTPENCVCKVIATFLTTPLPPPATAGFFITGNQEMLPKESHRGSSWETLIMPLISPGGFG